MVQRRNILISYDVDTTTQAGRKRLRNICKACKAYGQRVQYSVFECSVTEEGYEMLIGKALSIIDQEEDSLRVYRLPGKREQLVTVYGKDRYIDFEKPLVV
jgi:CRISPR-associated protein Cas2